MKMIDCLKNRLDLLEVNYKDEGEVIWMDGLNGVRDFAETQSTEGMECLMDDLGTCYYHLDVAGALALLGV